MSSFEEAMKVSIIIAEKTCRENQCLAYCCGWLCTSSAKSHFLVQPILQSDCDVTLAKSLVVGFIGPGNFPHLYADLYSAWVG